MSEYQFNYREEGRACCFKCKNTIGGIDELFCSKQEDKIVSSFAICDLFEEPESPMGFSIGPSVLMNEDDFKNYSLCQEND